MAKYIPETLQGGFSDKDLINAEFQKLATIINDQLLSRSNTLTNPNQLESAIDVNSQRLYNVPAATQGDHAVNYDQLLATIGQSTFTGTQVQSFTATAGQTVFTLIAGDYLPGVNSLFVYVNGVLYTDYVETSSTVFTMNSGLDEGDSVLAVINQRAVSGDSVTASSVSITIDGSPTNLENQVQALNTSVSALALQERWRVGREPVELIAHRGFKANNYENTLLAMSYSLVQGADSLEMDASISSDGVWYIFHDTAVDSLTDGTGDFTTLTSAYIDTLQISKAIGTPHEGLGVTKLVDVLEFLQRTRVKAYIELKNLASTDADVDSFMALITQYDLLDQVHVQAAQSDRLARVRVHSSTIEVGYLTSSTDTTAIITAAQAIGANSVLNSYSNFIATAGMAEAFRAAGLDPIAYTSNIAYEFDQTIASGVYKIMSDRSVIR